MKKILAFLLVGSLFIGSQTATAQALGSDYQTAVGFKFYPTAISVKHFIKSDAALEGLLYIWGDGIRVTGLYEYHGNFDNVEGLRWYIGGGAHIGFWNDEWRRSYPGRKKGVNIGVDGVLGLDYKIKGAPINISLDWQPSVSFIGYNYWESGWGGLGIRFAF
ncbi:hypothetical protein [Gynurincola endophyticus]|jgi:hypothetical protein|uniref:hypothetical protein n=1 Tax=Gynurincola endophyticus TaxID=2479004 RepID=UPI000F8D0B3A|nr:hypothetical protein [Gynurincola endophyticus]